MMVNYFELDELVNCGYYGWLWLIMVAYGWLWLLMMNIGELLKHPQLVITIDDLKPPVCRISGMANFWEMFGDPKTEKNQWVGCWMLDIAP